MRDATLCYPIEDGRVLLIEKKRGVGEGFFNGPGGKIEPGETPREAAVREVREEVGLAASNLEKVGELGFTFGDEPFTFVHVYRTETFVGRPRETDEAVPEWFAFDEVPYDEMWADDRRWLPHVFEGRRFAGEFVFDAEGEEFLDGDVETGVTFD